MVKERTCKNKVEIWLPIKHYKGIYEVSNLGNVRSLDRIVESITGFRKLKGKTLKQNETNEGYVNVSLNNKGKTIKAVSTIVAEAFIGIKSKGYEVKHKDNDLSNNALSNLKYVKRKIKDYQVKSKEIKTNKLEWLTQDYLKSRVTYSKKTGIFTWKNHPDSPKWWNTRFSGKKAGNKLSNGYIHIYLKDTPILAHRLAWLYVKGKNCKYIIDHEDHNPSNNKWANLREAPGSGNSQNSLKNTANTSGFKGVVKHKNKWKAQLYILNKVKYIGVYQTKEEAHKAYMKHAKKHFGKFAHSGDAGEKWAKKERAKLDD